MYGVHRAVVRRTTVTGPNPGGIAAAAAV